MSKAIAGKTVAVVLSIGMMATAILAAEKESLSPPVYLPDGQEFKTWDVPLKFTKTYHVDQNDPAASDDNPGTKNRPLRTIHRAAELLQPGERVVIASGTYRERITPARGGIGPESMISYEAAPDAKVIIKGSRILETKWKPSVHGDNQAKAGLWMTAMPENLLAADENPFKEVNLTDEQIDKCMPWAPATKGKPPNTLRRGLIFQNGHRLKQVAAYGELGQSTGSYWVESDGLTLHIHPFDSAELNAETFEVTTQGFIFAPADFGLGYIRVKGFVFEHAGNYFPRPQQGALSAQRGHHWIIEDNTVRQCNSIGIDIGDQFYTSGPKLAEGGQHIVRRNTISDCGIGGIEGKCIEHTLIEDNVIRRCGWQQALQIWETGGIKVHCTVSTLIRRNLVTDTVQAPGIWMDYANVNSRCTQNVIVNAQAPNGGIFMEASQKPNMVDRNFIWGTQGNGIYQHDCDELTIAHNFIAKNTSAGIRMQIMKDRQVGGRLSTAKRNRILNNILVDNGSMFVISDPDNMCDYNVLAGSAEAFDLASWRAEKGWDKHSLTANIAVSFDAEQLELTWSTGEEIPTVPRIEYVTHDFWSNPIGGENVAPGPFGTVPTTSKGDRLRLLP